MTNNLPTIKESYSVDEVGSQVQQIQLLMRKHMQKDTHFGVVPGCGDKPTLLKAGAEKLCFMFRLAPSVETEVIDMDKGHREYRVKCTLTHIATGNMVAQGMGSCTTLEGKYRYRAENTGNAVPQAYWDNRDPELLGGPQFSTRKINGNWMIMHKVEHDNPADYWNTCLKMAEKRAKVNAALSGTAASDIFTQDVEDMSEVLPSDTEIKREPEMVKQPPNVYRSDAVAGSTFYYKIPYKDEDSRALAKENGCRWNKSKKTWDGPYIEPLSAFIEGGGDPEVLEVLEDEPDNDFPPVDSYNF